MNCITKKDANLPFSVDEFSKKFAKMHVVLLINMFFKYDQIPFDKKNCDMIVIMTSIKLLQKMQLPQKTMNLMTQFIKIMHHVFKKLTSHICNQFLDDIEVKKSKIDYEEKKTLLNI